MCRIPKIPVVVSPTIAAVALSFYTYGFTQLGECLEIGILQILIVIIFSLNRSQQHRKVASGDSGQWWQAVVVVAGKGGGGPESFTESKVTTGSMADFQGTCFCVLINKFKTRKAGSCIIGRLLLLGYTSLFTRRLFLPRYWKPGVACQFLVGF
ncbi:hypothetical protein L1887_06115 [Cichorium endivia]|nr:hypothetical protein L1887_06115 [Cichorium endivia]